MSWLRDGRLQCDKHFVEIFDYPGPRRLLIDAARVRGWVVFDGETLGGKELRVHMCPICTKRAREPLTKKMDEDIPLWDEGGEINE